MKFRVHFADGHKMDVDTIDSSKAAVEARDVYPNVLVTKVKRVKELENA